MDTAVAGLIAGAVVTGGVQAVAAISARRLGSRTGGRLMIASIVSARGYLMVVRKHNTWGPADHDWRKFLAPWEEHQEALMRVLPARDCVSLSAMFGQLDIVIAARESALATGDATLDSDIASALTTVLANADEALRVMWKAGLTFRERRKAHPLPIAGAPPVLPKERPN